MARDFDGSVDNIDIGRQAALEGAAAMSVAAWVKWEGSFPTNPKTISRKQGATNLTYALGMYWNEGPQARFWVWTDTVYNTGDGTTNVADGNWHHVAGTYDGANIRLFVNGAQENSAAVTGNLFSDTANTIIGRWNSGGEGAGQKEPWDGLLAEHALWDAALSADEIAALARGFLPHRVRQTSLLGYWPLWGLDSVEPDLTRNASNGLLTGTTRGNHAPVLPFSRSLWTIGFEPAAGGGVEVTPAAASARAMATAPTVQLGSLSLTPASAAAQVVAIAPTTRLGSLSLTPAVAPARAVVITPTVRLGSLLSLTPATAAARTDTVAPSIHLGSLTATPTPAIARLLAQQPTVRLGSLSITPTGAIARLLAFAPTVQTGSPTTLQPTLFHPLRGASGIRTALLNVSGGRTALRGAP